MRLPVELESRLHDAGRVGLTRDAAKSARTYATSKTGARVAEPHSIKGIEHLPAELHVVALLKGKVLEDSQVEVVLSRPLDNVAARVSEGPRGVTLEGSGIKVTHQPVVLRSLMNIQRLPGKVSTIAAY